MEGETSELENLDSELVMSFYDQYHADDISKVYSNMPDKTGDTGVLDLKSSLTSSLAPDIAPSTSQVWNLPDFLVGLDGLQRLQSFSESSAAVTPHDPSSAHSILSSSQTHIQTNSNILNNNISTDINKGSQGDQKSYLFDSFRHCTDSLLEGLGILPPVKSEPSFSSSLNGLESLELEITPFELNLKSEPGVNSLVNISNISNLSSVSSLDVLSSTKSESPISVDPMITQHCTLLPPELISEQSLLHPNLRTANFVATVDDITDHPLSDVSQSFLLQESLKEEEEMEKPVELESNTAYKRCHLCVRIFSTKANLSSHIRHVHLGETKHSRVKSIPCPHCHKMFSRKGHMTEHVRTVHEGKKRIYKEVNCQHCGKTFRRKWGLNIHISSAHADVVSSLLKQ